MMDYYQALKAIHRTIKPRTYVEIGVRSGESFQYAYAGALCVGIDPAMIISFPMNASSRLFKMTSDDFFSKYLLTEVLDQQTVDLAFIDGMHLFEFALRDFVNLEKYCRTDSCILLHDTLPIDRPTSERERKTAVWTGDVWKLIPCLKKYRPDLNIRTFEVSPSGLSVITNLDPGSTYLSDNLNRICEEYIPVDYSAIENNKRTALAVESIAERDLKKVFRTKRESLIQKAYRIMSGSVSARRNQRPRCLGVLLCYNDADILGDVLDHLIANRHDIVAWDHGSDDGTAAVLDKYESKLIERKFVPRSFDFYNLYQQMSHNIIDNYLDQYDWISWPDDDEVLEGPARDKTYYEYICEVYRSHYDYIQFNNFNFWFTGEDDGDIASPAKRIRRYCLFPDCAPRIRSWRAAKTNIREFNHNPVEGEKYPIEFNLRHYPMRTHVQMIRRLKKDRTNLQRGGMNYHYDNMKDNAERMMIKPELLHYDDGMSELDSRVIFNWRDLYGYPPPA